MREDNPKEDLSFGRVALEKRYVSEQELKEALDVQVKLRAMGVHPKRLGEILLERGYLTRKQSENILATQRNLEAQRKIPGYEILTELGRGGMGTVYRAVQRSMNREVALKVLSPRHARNKDYITRFLREARLVAKLSHENIIAGIDVGEADGLYYFAMEYVEGDTVVEIIRREGAILEKKAIDIVLQIARALEHADKNGLVHRDVKPQNIIVTHKGIAKLCDLGLAKADDSEAHITHAGISIGTPHYISPEQAKGLADVDIRSDIYSLGASFYHMVVGEVPFVGSSPMVVMTKHLTEDVPFPADKNLDLSVSTGEVIYKMMEKRVEDRYQSPAELLVDLERIAQGLPPAIAGKRPVTGRLSRPSRRRPSTRRRARRGRFIGRRKLSALRTHRRHEGVMLAVFMLAVIFMFAFAVLMGYVSSGQDIVDRIDYGKYEAEKVELEASGALEEARQFDRANPYEDKEVIARKYREVFEKYPDSVVAKEAKERYEEVLQRRK